MLAAKPPNKNQTTYNIHYNLPAADFTLQTKNEGSEVAIGTGLLGVNRLGARVALKVRSVMAAIDPEKYRANPNGLIEFDEQINLPKGESFLYIMVWDEDSGRFGTVQAPLNVPKRTK